MLQTILQLLQLAPKNNVAGLDAELLLAQVLKKPREFILAHPELQINNIKTTNYKKLLKKRAQNIPLAYLTGHKEFFGLDFLVNKHVLIPRPETELMVELVLKKLRTQNSELRTTLVDVGTGSGCIPISVIKTLKHQNIKTLAIDISDKALAVAQKNAKLNKVKIKFLHGDLLTPFTDNNSITQLHNQNIIITANLPYLTPQQLKQEPSIQHEPKLALVAGKDGLKYYRQLLKQLSLLYKLYNFTNFITFLEIDPSQTKSIKLLIKKILPQTKIEIHKDLAGKNRVVEIK